MKTVNIKGKEILYYNVDDNKINYSQRDNEYKWFNKDVKVDYSTTCNVTSICMGLDYAGFKFPKGKYKQPEDNLAEFIMNSKLVNDEYKKRYPVMYEEYKKGLKDAYTPNEIHKLLEIGVNEWMQAKVDTFREDVSIKEITQQICSYQRPVIISGSFPQPDGRVFNHIVCLVGIGFLKSNFFEPEYYVIDDPWGNTLDYKNKNGNDVWLTKQEFTKLIKPINNDKIKFAHILSSPVAIV